MRHFSFLTQTELASLFLVPPADFDRDSARAHLSMALGATLYSPGTRTTLAADTVRAAAAGVTSHVWCLEDAIAHDDVPFAQDNVVTQLQALHGLRTTGPTSRSLLFIRVRTAEQLLMVVEQAGPAVVELTGFVLPKIAADERGEAMFSALVKGSELAGVQLFAMPVLEHENLAWRETRAEHLQQVGELFSRFQEHILSLRVGGTDLCGLFGLRRDRDTTIWDVAVVRDALADVLNTFGRRRLFAISAPVWEHFGGHDRLFKPQLRSTPFERAGRIRLRQQLLHDDADGLLREVLLDRANGFHGKTAIHPSHVPIINALHVVDREEYDDARLVLDARGKGGAVRSSAGNKMNELGPHELWAQEVADRAAAFGVLASPDAVLELLQLGRLAVERQYPAEPAKAPLAGSAS